MKRQNLFLCALIKAPTMVSRVFVVVLNTRYADSNYIDILYQAFFFTMEKDDYCLTFNVISKISH